MVLILYFLVCFCCVCAIGQAQELDNAKRKEIGSVAAKSIAISVKSDVVEDSNMFADENFGEALTEAMESAPTPTDLQDHPRNFAYLDPNLLQHPDACDRDYSLPCPLNFVLSSTVHQDHVECIPLETYKGSCANPILFKMSSSDEIAKRAFSERCLANWPCIVCQRDYGQQCPLKFRPDGLEKCVPTPDYHGPCKTPVSFWMNNVAMIERWSSRCFAYFPCKSLSGNMSFGAESHSLGQINSLLRVSKFS